jgi:hypothetical protein
MEDIEEYERKMKNNKMEKSGKIYSETMKTADGDIIGEVRYNDHYKTYQVVIDGVTYEEFKSKAEAIENLNNAGFGKMAKGGAVGDTIADRYARLTKTEGKRLDELSKKVRINEQTEAEDVEWDKLVHKYRGWDYANKMAKGGGVHTMPNGEVMLDSEHYAKGGNVDDNIIDTKQAKNHDEVYNILDKWGNKKRIVNAPSWDLETPYSRGWVEEGEKITVILKKVIEVGKPTFYIWSWKKVYKEGGIINNGEYGAIIDWKNFTLNELDAFLKYWSIGKGEIEINLFAPKGVDYVRTIDYKKYGNEKLSVGDVGKQAKITKGSENIYLDITVYNEKNEEYVIGLYSKENHNGLKQIAKDLIDKYAKGGTISDAKSIFDKYEKNEDNNYHAENIVLLAKHFGTDEDIDTANKIIKQRNKLGYMPKDMSEKSSEISKRLYPKLIQELNQTNNKTNTMEQEKIEKFVEIAKSTNKVASEIAIRKLKEAGLDKNGKEIKEEAPKQVRKVVAKKVTPKKVESTPKKVEKSNEPDCDDLYEQYEKRKKAQKKAKNAPQKTETTKNKEKIEKVEDSIDVQFKAGKLTKEALQKMYKETKALLVKIEKYLAKL